MFNGMTDEEFIAHYGKLGMKWGHRTSRGGYVRKGSGPKKSRQEKSMDKATKKLQNERDKAAVKALKKQAKDVRNGKTSAATKPQQKSPTKTLTDQELQQRISRIRMEAEYKKLTTPQRSMGEKMVMNALTKTGDKIITAAVQATARAVIKKTTGFDIDPPKKSKKDKDGSTSTVKSDPVSKSILKDAKNEGSYPSPSSKKKKEK